MLVTFIIVCSLGIIACRLIIFRYLKKSDPLLDRLCRVNSDFDCDAVLESSFGKLSENIRLGDLALVYFLSQLIFTFICLINNNSAWGSILLIPGIIAFFLTIILVLYQWAVIKSWCKLCLLLTGIIWFQLIVIGLHLYFSDPYWTSVFFDDLFSEKFRSPILLFILSIAICSCWFNIKPQLIKANEVDSIKKQLHRWKHDPLMFNSALQLNRVVSEEYWDEEILLGNPNADIRLLVAISTHCRACSREFKQIAYLIRQYPHDISVRFRFSVNLEKVNIKTQVVQFLHNTYSALPEHKKLQILEDWYKKTDFNGLKKEYAGSTLKDDTILSKYEQWFKDSEIKYVPTLFLNGHEFPKPFTVYDLKYLIPKMKEKMSKSMA